MPEEILDLDAISTEDLVEAALSCGDEEDALDLNEVPTEELVDAALESEMEKTAQEEEAMSFEYLDHAGRVLAHRIANGEFEGL